jgi:signal transduction histidine kinase
MTKDPTHDLTKAAAPTTVYDRRAANGRRPSGEHAAAPGAPARPLPVFGAPAADLRADLAASLADTDERAAVRPRTPEEAEIALAPVYRRGDRWMGALVAVHALLALALGSAHDTWRVTLPVTAVSAALFYVVRWRHPGAFVTRATASVVLQAFCALHIYQMGGLAEMHFFYFTSVTAMILYQDWRALWPGIAAIIAQHTLFSVLHNAGARPGGQAFFEPEMVSATKLAWHYAIALAQAAIAGYAAAVLRARTLRAAGQRDALVEQALTLSEMNTELAERTTALDLRNERLQEQAAELEMQSTQLQEQATELEMQNGELVVTSEALWRQTQEAETARREAEAANVAKGRFLASMSHELRTPLNAVGGYAELLSMGIRGPVTDEQRHDLERIRRSSQHLLSLINDILQYAKLESGQIAVETRDVPVAPVLEELVTLVGPQLETRRLVYACAPCAPTLQVRADRDRLIQVLLNLLTNAVKYTEPGGRIEVWCEAAPDAGANGAGHDGPHAAAPTTVAVHVRDTGVGIPLDMQSKVFDPFVQVRRTLATPEGGVGLGLAISRDLARAMGGELHVQSEVGRGSTFTLVLPRGADVPQPAAVA